MRFEGTLKTWNDERGFGFLEPLKGGEDIFVHAKAFGPRTGRPRVGQMVTFELEIGPQGKKRAKNVELVRRIGNQRLEPRDPPAKWGPAAVLAIPLFAALYYFVDALWKPSLVVAAIYAVVSVFTFFAYALDKSAARRGEWRTPESTLHFLAFAGGWLGALLAQQLLRHKTTKPEFRLAFWGTVILNEAAFVLICSPIGQTFFTRH